jgi:hypothetical protein
MKVFFLYGSMADLEETSGRLERDLGIPFDGHDSAYFGGYYQAKTGTGEEISIKNNKLKDSDGEYFQYPEYSEFPTILNIAVVVPQGGVAELTRSETEDRIRELGYVSYLKKAVPRGRSRQPRS